jgi:DNA repair exonuclease SbcCD ATPase subunit
VAEIVYATIEDDAEIVPPEMRCIWPGCTRRRAPERAAGSGRQKEYCLKADRPGSGGGPVHNARNRWVRLRNTGNAADDSTGADDPPRDTVTVRGAEAHASVRDKWPVSTATQRASELLDQAHRQHRAALTSLQAERELYQQLGEQFRVMSDPAALDLEIASIGLKAGRDVSQAGEEAARARRAQLQAERERDEALRLKEHADAAAEQFAADTEFAERVLAERTSEFERERDLLQRRVREAQEHADRVSAQAEAVKATAEAAAADARQQAREEIAAAQARADAQAERAQQQAAAVAADARRQIAETRDRAAAGVAAARAEAEQARADAQRARAEAETMREALRQARDDAQARIAAAETSVAVANARAAVVQAEIERLRDERTAELARLLAAHKAALDAERARAKRAEGELDALRADAGR